MSLASQFYFNDFTRKLTLLAYEIDIRGHLNILDLNIHAETFYARLLNLIFGYSLTNLNAVSQNAAGIDLVDHSAKIVLQVSSTATRTKVESSLGKDLSKFAGYGFKFVALTADASSLKGKSFANPHKLSFDSDSDIFDVKGISNIFLTLDSVKQKKVYEFLRVEMAYEDTKPPQESNLAALIKILGGEDLRPQNQVNDPIPFNVDDKIAFNNLDIVSQIIEDHKIYYHKVDKIYSTFDQVGQNKSTSVLAAFGRTYNQLGSQFKDDELFFAIVQHTIEAVKASSNYEAMAREELELCVNILAADAFIRCRIFKNPRVVKNAAA